MIVRAKDRAALHNPVEGGPLVVVSAGQPFDSEDPLVRMHSWLFESEEVESATAAPGERRTINRR